MQHVITCGTCGFSRGYATPAKAVKATHNHTQNKHHGEKPQYTMVEAPGESDAKPGTRPDQSTTEFRVKRKYTRRNKRKYTRRAQAVESSSEERTTPLMIRHCPSCGFNIELINRAAIMAFKFK